MQFDSDKLFGVAVAAVIPNQAGRFLIVKRSENEKFLPNKWEFPSGRMEKNETIIEVLKREIKEKAGLEIKDEKIFLHDLSFKRSDGQTVKVLTFLTFAKNFAVKISDEFDDYAWVKPDEIKKYDCLDLIPERIALAHAYLKTS